MKNLKVLLAFFISAFMLPCTVLASDGGVAASIIKDPVVDTLFSIIIILSIVIEIKTAGFFRRKPYSHSGGPYPHRNELVL